MKCFRHSKTDAVGVCLVCGKALCRKCGNHKGPFFTCRGQCAQLAQRRVKEYEEQLATLEQQNAQMTDLETRFRKLPTGQGGLFVSALLVLVGVPFFVLGFSANDKLGLGRWLGGVFIVMGIVYFFVHRKAVAIVRDAEPRR